MAEEKRMSFLEHLEELRWRLVRSAIAILIVAIALWFYKGWIFENLFMTMKSKDFITFDFLCKYLGVCMDDITVGTQSTTVTGQFSYALMMSIMGGFVVAFPFVFYQFWGFVKPGLRQNEKSVAKGIILYVTLLFFTGVAFGYFVVAPLCIQFFGGFTITDEVVNDFTINSYMSMVLSTIFYSGLLFLLPVLSYLLTKLGILGSDFLKKYRKHAIIAILILSAFITPPDLISQVIVGIPILILYEIGIFVSKRVEKQRKNQA
ncbi:MAG: twin-arginine translocase subunit TatC [Crocinitomicaceae bacterium]